MQRSGAVIAILVEGYLRSVSVKLFVDRAIGLGVNAV